MDYEELYRQMQVVEKELKEKLSGMQKAFRVLSKDSEKGELKALPKNIGQMRGFMEDYKNAIDEYTRIMDSFDPKEYIECGDFARQMIQYCGELSVDIKGEHPVYEIFPYRVRIDSENQELYVDRKKSQCLRPQYFVDSIKRSQDKLNKAAFNADAFLNELAEAYDLALLQKESRTTASKGRSAGIREYDIFLKDLYSIMVPMQRFRREYDLQNYAFDLTRLYNSEIEMAKDGRLFEFGSSRNASKLIRILDRDGKEQYLGTIRFYKTV